MWLWWCAATCEVLRCGRKNPRNFRGIFTFGNGRKIRLFLLGFSRIYRLTRELLGFRFSLKPALSGRSLVKSALLGAPFGSRIRRSFPRDSREILERPRGRNSRRFPFRSFRSRYRIGARRRGARRGDFLPGRRKNPRRIRAGIRRL